MAESKLRIILELKDKATASLDKFNKGISETGKTLHNAVKGFETLGAAGAAALFTLNKGLDATIGTYVQYGQQVRELSTNLGISTEETSRLIQVSDDFKISIEEVRTAMQMAAKNGFEPSIENLANLADELQGMEKATDRAARMSKIFGRNWATLNPLLAEGGDALRKNAASIQANLILTEESVKRTREWELALDEWEDRVEAAKIGIGSFLVEGLLPYFRIMDAMPAVMNEMSRRLSDTVPADSQIGRWVGMGQAIEEVEDTFIQVDEAMDQHIAATDRHIAAERLRFESLRRTKEEWMDIVAAPRDIDWNIDFRGAGIFDDIQNFLSGGGEIEEVEATIIAGLDTGTLPPEIAQAIAGEALVWEMVVDTSQGEISARDAKTRITEVMNITSQEASTLFQAAWSQFQMDGPIAVEEWATDAQLRISTASHAFKESLRVGIISPMAEAGEKAKDVVDRLNEAVSHPWRIEIQYDISGAPPGGFQHGGSFIVGGPPGIDRSLVAFNATRGERVDITPSGASKGGGRIQIGPNYITSDNDEQAFAERMKISLRRLL